MSTNGLTKSASAIVVKMAITAMVVINSIRVKPLEGEAVPQADLAGLMKEVKADRRIPGAGQCSVHGRIFWLKPFLIAVWAQKHPLSAPFSRV
ncbi:hypothetical protein [Ideonella paludis]|uniref:hypothetical protein n=1 Tax=Ideonella paludis TaxID=1233411 RepID=UPI00363A28AC